MGNRALICTQKDWEAGKGIGVYLHWNGGRDSVEAFLTYCRLRGFCTPESDGYGWARFCQIVSNFFGGDGSSIGIDFYDNIKDMDVWDNGTYIIKDWRIVDRAHFSGEEQNEYNLLKMLITLDNYQPEKHRLGEMLIQDLMRNGRVVTDLDWNYYWHISEMEGENIKGEPFKLGNRYEAEYRDGPVITVNAFIGKDEYTQAEIIYEGKKYLAELYNWRNGMQSLLFDVNGEFKSYTSQR